MSTNLNLGYILIAIKFFEMQLFECIEKLFGFITNEIYSNVVLFVMH